MFEYRKGITPTIIHKVDLLHPEAREGELIAAYAACTLKGGGEVAQPAHKVVFRLQSSPLACKLIECDGGAWKLEAIANIRTWLIENLPEGVKVIA